VFHRLLITTGRYFQTAAAAAAAVEPFETLPSGYRPADIVPVTAVDKQTSNSIRYTLIVAAIRREFFVNIRGPAAGSFYASSIAESTSDRRWRH
jgi:hypothetical protein